MKNYIHIIISHKYIYCIYIYIYDYMCVCVRLISCYVILSEFCKAFFDAVTFEGSTWSKTAVCALAMGKSSWD